MVLGFVFVIVLLLGLGAVWGLGWFFSLALGVKIALTVLLLAFLGLLLVLRHLKSVRAARHLERAIVAPGSSPTPPVTTRVGIPSV